MRKPAYFSVHGYYPVLWSLVILLFLANQPGVAQTCPGHGTTNITTYPNTYFPGGQSSVNAGSKTIKVGASTLGSTAISNGDILLIIQMQGAEINSSNSSSFGDGTGVGSGYLSAGLTAGYMEYVTATNSVPLTGGNITLSTGLVHSYSIAGYSTYGQYTYQVIRVPLFYDLRITATITAPAWNGSSGGVLVLAATDDIALNNQTIDASGMGFRGGGGRSLSGSNSTSNTDYATGAATKVNGSKGEGIAGTPQYVNNSGTVVKGGSEGYPGGSMARGAPGNAGGGGTDGDPSSNDENTGGGGGSNGGVGGNGGNSWNSNLPTGGLAGAIFAEVSASRLVMGGGGGAGTSNNGTGTPNNGVASSGTAGGGIIILYSQNTISGSGTIKANGTDGYTTVQNDGAGGGGAGGSILIYEATGANTNIKVQAMGGAGGSNETAGGPSHGPGGGGGGGVILSTAALNAASSAAGGAAGTTAGTTTNYGATSGSTGSLVSNVTPSTIASLPIICAVLPASFVNVTAHTANNAIDIGWTVAYESNTFGYIVERSTDGANFFPIDSIPYQANMDVTNSYQYSDASGYSMGGTLYYRIRASETNGRSIYSKIVTIQSNNTSTDKLDVYPNPARGSVTVRFAMTTPGSVTLRLFDVKGTRIWEQQYQTSAGQNNLQVDRIASLPEGVYLLQWFDGLSPRMVKLLVQH